MNKALARAFGTASNSRGFGNEQRVIDACADWPDKPSWLISVALGTKEQDAQKIDIVAATDVGDLFLQIKSSHAGLKAFYALPQKHRAWIEAIKVTHSDSEERIRNKVRTALTALYKQVLERRGLA